MTQMQQWAALQRTAANAIAAAADAYPWVSATMWFRALWATSEAVVQVSLQDGSTEWTESPAGAEDAMEQLREDMATPETGAWYTAVIRLDRQDDGQVRMNVDYDYDRRPAWAGTDPDDEDYVEDHERFPRPAAKVPAWHPAHA